MKTDEQIQKDVMEELGWQPYLKPSEIGVAVNHGIVTLSGQVDSYFKKLEAEKAARKVSGVKAIAEDIQIGVLSAGNKTDADIAEAVVNALKWHSVVPEEEIKIKVENGTVILEGEVEWQFQRNSAKTAIENLTGVRHVTNLITVKPKVSPSAIQQKISSAFHRSATIDAARITAEVSGSKVTLRGNVRSFVEKEDAERAAWNAPGVTSIESKLQIEEPEYEFEDF